MENKGLHERVSIKHYEKGLNSGVREPREKITKQVSQGIFREG